MPNGYLLYNFAATFLVDMTQQQSKWFYSLELIIVNVLYFVLLILTPEEVANIENLGYVPDKSVLSHHNVLISIVTTTVIVGVLALLFAFLHWKVSISPLFEDVQEVESNKNPNTNVEVHEEIPME